MIGDFINNGKSYPAVGISFGLDVIFEILKEREDLNKNILRVYILPMENKIKALKIAQKMRENNINVDIDMNDLKLKKALNYANKEEIPYVIIIGDEELKENKIILKDMKNGTQSKIRIDEIISNIKIKRGDEKKYVKKRL